MERKRRSILKAVSWRITATITTMTIVYVFTNQLLLSLQVGFLEASTKIMLFYAHERVWNKVHWGRLTAAL
ncbi:MAG: DUF2061 domain-containing protein [Candidatus Altiarchaeota archaeon]